MNIIGMDVCYWSEGFEIEISRRSDVLGSEETILENFVGISDKWS